nr:MAG TPA: hypothetical protein [Caudoviricetes sp.]
MISCLFVFCKKKNNFYLMNDKKYNKNGQDPPYFGISFT